MESLVSTEWLAEHLGEVTVVDCSWFMPASGRSGRDEYLDAHIPGARFLDIDEVADRSNPAPHMLPTADEFAAAMEQLGIGSDDRIVVYDNSPDADGGARLVHASPLRRARGRGARRRTAEMGRGRPPDRERRSSAANARASTLARVPTYCTKEQILAGAGCALVDARGKGRFEGSEPEPRAGLAGGPYPRLPQPAVRPALPRGRHVQVARGNSRGIRPRRNRSGAAIRRQLAARVSRPRYLIFAAHLIGGEGHKLYDGSWSEWGADPATPKAVGPA